MKFFIIFKDEMFYHFQRAFSEADKKIFLEGEIPTLKKYSFKTDAVFLSFFTMLSSSARVIFSLETTLFDNKGLTTPRNFLLSHKSVSFRLSANFYFSQKCNT